MKTTQQAFHPMLGHMEIGCKIVCDNGDVLTLNQSMSGWVLTNQRGEFHGAPTHDSSMITRYVMGYGA